ncbi:MAG: ribonuclease H family protein [Campylobacterota bacterium]|nr:ribonuclease H family protein [Campylobacterota bacterium]
MKLITQLLDLASHSNTLNKRQFELLGVSYPPSDGWRDDVMGMEMSVGDVNLLVMLRGELSIRAQKQIASNYRVLTEFHNPKERRESKSKEPKNSSNFSSLEIYCDGACKGNPGKAGSGLAIYGADKSRPTLLYGEFEPRGTNNTAELNALYKALLIASEYIDSGNITILSDSKYSIDCITKWAYGWKRNGWKKKSGEIKNLEIIKLAHELYDKIKESITIKHVKGHSGIEGNELADRMAVLAIKRQETQYRERDYKNIDEILH